MKKKVTGKIFAIVGIILASIVGIGLFSSIALYFAYTKDVTLDISKIEKINSENIISYFDAEGNEISSNDSYVDITKLKKETIDAFIAKEDKRFYKHNGYDIVRIFGAMYNNIKSGEITQGGSTITQQLIKNVQLSQEKTLKRKLQEIKLASELEKLYTKNEILEMYLNSIYFGNNCYGIESASKYYFNKSSSDLTLSESAMLSGIISAPSEYNPKADIEIAKQKRNIVLDLMCEQNFITEEQKLSAKNEEIQVNIDSAKIDYSTYIESARREVCEMLKVSELPTNKTIKVYTNLDSKLQLAADNIASNKVFDTTNSKGIMSDIAYVVIDNKNGKVISFGGKSQFDLSLLKRQPASTIKPILVYAPAIENNIISPATPILDEKINYDGYSPENANYGYTGWTTVRDSLVYSLNVPSVKILQANGIEKSKDKAKEFGLSFSQFDTGYAISLGGLTDGIGFVELANAYSVFANNGNYSPVSFVNKIEIDGEIIEQSPKKEQKIIQDSTAYLITNMLKETKTRGTAKLMGDLNFDIASKTGTGAINGQNNDAWNVSYTPSYTLLCWVGNTHGKEGLMENKINGSSLPTLFVKEMTKTLKLEVKNEKFVMPSSIQEVEIDTSEIDKITQANENTAERTKKVEYFSLRNLPQESQNQYCDLIAPIIWVEIEEAPKVNFKSQVGVTYSVYRSAKDINNLFFMNNAVFQTQNRTLFEFNKPIQVLIGTGRNVSIIDHSSSKGRYEYYVIASIENEQKESNHISVLLQ